MTSSEPLPCRLCGAPIKGKGRTWDSVSRLQGASARIVCRPESDRVCEACRQSILRACEGGLEELSVSNDSGASRELAGQESTRVHHGLVTDPAHRVPTFENPVPSPLLAPLLREEKVFVPAHRLEGIKRSNLGRPGCPTRCPTCLVPCPLVSVIQDGVRYVACTFCIKYCMRSEGWDNRGNYSEDLKQAAMAEAQRRDSEQGFFPARGKLPKSPPISPQLKLPPSARPPPLELPPADAVDTQAPEFKKAMEASQRLFAAVSKLMEKDTVEALQMMKAQKPPAAPFVDPRVPPPGTFERCAICNYEGRKMLGKPWPGGSYNGVFYPKGWVCVGCADRALRRICKPPEAMEL